MRTLACGAEVVTIDHICGLMLDLDLRKPCFLGNSVASCSPHTAPRPSPPSASETVMQCMHEIVYR